jgi:hypothetical protein
MESKGNMKLVERELKIPAYSGTGTLLDYFRNEIERVSDLRSAPVNFVITRTVHDVHHCETAFLLAEDTETLPYVPSPFEYRRRLSANTEQFNAVLIVPTGIGAKIGGDAGDASPVARLLASICDNLITHPNVVNASDINELPPNGLYVEGSVLTRLLLGTVSLRKVRSNRVLLVIDEHDDEYFTDSAINSASAARTTLGLECTVLKMRPRIRMKTHYSSHGRATGQITKLENLIKLLEDHRHTFDAIAISSIIEVPNSLQFDYFAEEMTNPWGGVEAMLTHTLSSIFTVPSAHSPMMENREILNWELGVVDPRKAAEAISLTFLHCILKGLHRSPQIIDNVDAIGRSGFIGAEDISCLIIPDGCMGLPVLAAIEQGIPVIAVKENANNMRNDLTTFPFQSGKFFIVKNYLEAAGIIAALKAGVSAESVRRPISATVVHNRSNKTRINACLTLKTKN